MNDSDEERSIADLLKEESIKLDKAATIIPGCPHLATINRWISHGVGTPKVKLESFLVGNVRFTTREAIVRFLEKLNTKTQAASASLIARQRRRQVAQAQKELHEELHGESL